MRGLNVYWKPLKLEETNDGFFLETKFIQKGNTVQFRLKNKNENATEVWRYHHFNSALNYQMKRSCMMATLRKVHKMASDQVQLKISGMAKLKEFGNLGYPVGIRKYMCSIMARDYQCLTWRYIRTTQT